MDTASVTFLRERIPTGRTVPHKCTAGHEIMKATLSPLCLQGVSERRCNVAAIFCFQKSADSNSSGIKFWTFCPQPNPQFRPIFAKFVREPLAAKFLSKIGSGVPHSQIGPRVTKIPNFLAVISTVCIREQKPHFQHMKNSAKCETSLNNGYYT